MRETTLHTPSEEGRGRGAPGAATELLLQPTERTTLEQIATLQPIEDLMLGAGRYALKEAAAWEIPCWSREGLYPRGLPPMERLRAGLEEKSEEEEAAQRNSYRLTAAPHSPLCCSGGGRMCSFNLSLFITIQLYF